MHELGIAQSILDAVATEMQPHASARPVKVAVKVGAMSGVDPDSLAFCFESIAKGTVFEPMILEIQNAAADELELSYLELEEP